MANLGQRRKGLVASMMKEGIYESAVAVLTCRGVDGMTMDRVAEEAGVAKGSLYNYFPNKLELLLFVHERALAPIRQKTQEVLKAPSPAQPKLETLIRTWFDYLSDHRGLFNFLFNDYAIRKLLKEQDESGRASAIQDLTLIIQQGIEEGVFRPIDAEAVAALMFGAIREVVEQQLATEGTWPIGKLTEDLMGFFLQGLGANCRPQ